MFQRSRVIGVGVVLLLLSVLLSACGAVPVAQNWPGLTVANGIVYLISGAPQKVYLLDAETGVQKTTFIPPGEHQGVIWWSPVAVGGDLAFVGFSEPQAKVYGLYAFNPETAQQQWQVLTEDLILEAPVYADGVVYFGASDGRVYAVEVESGLMKPGWPFQAEEAIWASPLVEGGRVYVSSMDHHLYCLDGETGELIWRFEAGGALAAQPVMEDEILYVGGFDGKVYAVHADSGEAVEGFDFKAENWIWSEVLVVGDRLYVSSLDGKLYALDPSDGTVIQFYPYDAGSPLRAAPVEAGEAIIVAAKSGQVTAVRAESGQVLWQWSPGQPELLVLTTPVVWQGMVYVALADGQLQTLNAENGVLGWPFSPPAGN